MNIYLKLRNVLISIPDKKGLLSPCNQLLGKDPLNIFLHQNKALLLAICDCPHLLKMPTKFTTPCKELVTEWPHYIGVKDASSNGIGGIIIGEDKEFIPTVFRLSWPDYFKELFHTGNITNSDF